MRKRLVTLTTLLFILLAFTSAGAVDFEFTLSQGHTDNLFKDNSQFVDDYSKARLSVNQTLWSFGEVTLRGGNTYYHDFIPLSQWEVGGDISIIPTPDQSPFRVHLSGGGNKYFYRESDSAISAINTSEFASGDYNGRLAFGYALNRWMRTRLSVKYTSLDYDSDNVESNRKWLFSVGMNWSLPWRNALDIEGGYQTGSIQRLDPTFRGAIREAEAYGYLVDGDLGIGYVSPRLSRPLGKKTGINLIFAHRWWAGGDRDAVVYGYSSGLLSPWVNEYIGNAFQVNLKTYLVPHLVVAAGFGYWDNKYLTMFEKEMTPLGIEVLSTLVGFHERKDIQRKYFLGVKVPVQMAGLLMEPSLRADISRHSSTVDPYSYNDFSMSAELVVKL